MKLAAALLVVFIIVAAWIFFLQFQNQKKLLAENKSLMEQAAKMQSENESLSNRLAAVANAKSLADEQMHELTSLRDEVAVLRQQTNQIGNLLEENHQLHSQIQAAQNSQYQFATNQYALEHQQAIVATERLESAMENYAETHRGWFPANFDQLEKSGYLNNITLPSAFKLDDFELINAGLANNNMSEKLIFRQRNPYQTPDGKWVREYGFSNGGVTSQYSDDGNFSAFEQQHTVAPSPGQNQ